MASNEYFFDRESTWKEIDSIVASLGSLQCSLDPADNSLLSWLSSIDLSHHYEQILITNGFDHLDFMCPEFVDDDTLLEIGILNSNHRKKILRAVANRPSFQIIKNPESVHDWLDLLSLTEYLPLFEMNGFSSLRPEVEMSSLNGTTQLENGRDKTKEWERRYNSFLSGGCKYLIQYHGSKEIGEFTGNCSIKDIISAIKVKKFCSMRY
ncbi:DgyrCDS14238 [Dimorphilus gyrociliatus]|uniref:DgyrCDS14238 n=1 Tax=Dimorphilus gyrociliatus TaxID=2664684 RepID=A0A7I8WD87_9ANNE|nr:DgyrCDS14238 [Dimorphilus gyrociliatus]